MTQFTYHLTHKQQTKANDCWYACIQMLKTWKAQGKKTKAVGTHTSYLHGGVLGHKLRPDALGSKHFKHVLAENDMITIDNVFGISLKTMELPQGYTGASALGALMKHGPIIIGGEYGQIKVAGQLFMDNLGHFIVLAGLDTASKKYWIYDPDKRYPSWRDATWIADRWWNHDEAAIVLKPD